MKPIVAFTADWHIARSAWARSGIDGDSYHGLAQVVDHCLAAQIPLIAAGDLFDTKDPSPDDVRHVRVQLARMARARLKVYYIQGQHESEKKPWLSAIHPWAAHIHGESVEIAGFKFYGLDWQPSATVADALKAIPPGTDVLACHQVWREFMGDHVQSECSFADVRHASLVLTGDYHKHRVLVVAAGDRAITVLSPGSTCMQSIDEEPAKAFYDLCIDDDGDLAYVDVPLDNRAFDAFEVADEAELDALIVGMPIGVEAGGTLPEHLRMPLVRVRYPAGIAGAEKRLKAAAAGRFHLFLDPVSGLDSDGGDARAVIKALRERGIAGVLADMDLSDLPDPETTRRDVAALLAARDPLAVLEAICAES